MSFFNFDQGKLRIHVCVCDGIFKGVWGLVKPPKKSKSHKSKGCGAWFWGFWGFVVIMRRVCLYHKVESKNY